MFYKEAVKAYQTPKINQKAHVAYCLVLNSCTPSVVVQFIVTLNHG